MAKWMPASSRPGTSRSRGYSAPPDSATRVVVVEQRLDRDVDADLDAGAELDAFGLHLAHAPVDEALLHLEVGDAVAQQAADAVGLLEQRSPHGRRARAAGRRPCRPGRSRRPRRACRSAAAALRRDPAFVPAAVDDLRIRSILIVTGLSSMFSVQTASQGAGQMRPVNSGKLLVECRSSSAALPLVAIDQVVPVGDQVVDRAAVVAERNAAIHAARGLLARPRRPAAA